MSRSKNSPGTEAKDRLDPITGVKVGEVEVVSEDNHDEKPSEGPGASGIYGVSTTLFAIAIFLLCYEILPGMAPGSGSAMELSASTQVPFVFLGAGVVSGILLLQNNLKDLMSIRPHNFREYTNGSPTSISAAASLLTILVFAGLIFNVSMIPIISQDIPSFLTLITLLVLTFWAFILSKEGALSLIHI